MPELMRFHTIRGAEELPPEQLSKLGHETHPSDLQSDWFRSLSREYESGNQQNVSRLLVDFLRSDRSIHSLDQLNPDSRKVFDWLQARGDLRTEKDKKALFSVCDLRYFQDYFRIREKEEEGPATQNTGQFLSDFQREHQRLSDTILALSMLGKLGHRDNLNYLWLFKTLLLIRLLYEHKKEVSLAEILELLEKPVFLPARLFSAPPKLQATAGTEQPFGHLDIFEPDAGEQVPAPGLPDAAFFSREKEQHGSPDYKPLPFPPPTEKNCECGCDETCKEQSPGCAEIRPFLADLMIVREELKCYEAKHLAYIETVMLGESRQRVHRHLDRTETYRESETTQSRTEERDHQVAERFSLQSQAQKTIHADVSANAGVSTNSWGPGYRVNTSVNAAARYSKSESQRLAREQAVDITQRAVMKIQETVRDFSSKTTIAEREETNTHTFANEPGNGGIKHLNGMYQFVNAIHRGQVMNYGKRLMFEFVLPEPLEMYKKLMSKQVASFDLQPPTKPDLDPSDINDNPGNDFYYLNLARKYQVTDLKAPPQLEKALPFNISNDDALKDDNDYASAKPVDIGTVPEGYDATSIHTNFWVKSYSGKSASAHLFVHNTNLGTGDDNASIKVSEGERIMGTLLFQSSCAVGGSGVVYCRRKKETYESWQLEVYGQLMARYEEDLRAYEAERERWEALKEQQTRLGRNPFLNRETERTELKRMAVSYLTCQFYGQFTAMKRNVKPCGYPQMDLPQAQKEGEFINFFETLFEWPLMNYLFYPYFWGCKGSWPEKIQTRSGDPLFDKALMAGAARVQVPVRSGHEELALHWVAFGEIWLGRSRPPVPGSPYYTSMIQEIREQKGVFYTDRAGVLEVFNGRDHVILTGSAYHWDFSSNAVDQLKIDNDLDRELIIDCVAYRIVAIQPDPSDPTHETWQIQMERAYEGDDASGVKWSTGAVFVGAPFEITVPTNLVYLRNTKNDAGDYLTADCLPCFPQEKCE